MQCNGNIFKFGFEKKEKSAFSTDRPTLTGCISKTVRDKAQVATDN